VGVTVKTGLNLVRSKCEEVATHVQDAAAASGTLCEKLTDSFQKHKAMNVTNTTRIADLSRGFSLAQAQTLEETGHQAKRLKKNLEDFGTFPAKLTALDASGLQSDVLQDSEDTIMRLEGGLETLVSTGETRIRKILTPVVEMRSLCAAGLAASEETQDDDAGDTLHSPTAMIRDPQGRCNPRTPLQHIINRECFTSPKLRATPQRGDSTV
jgi:hypothetical protein